MCIESSSAILTSNLVTYRSGNRVEIACLLKKNNLFYQRRCDPYRRGDFAQCMFSNFASFFVTFVNDAGKRRGSNKKLPLRASNNDSLKRNAFNNAPCCYSVVSCVRVKLLMASLNYSECSFCKKRTYCRAIGRASGSENCQYRHDTLTLFVSDTKLSVNVSITGLSFSKVL